MVLSGERSTYACVRSSANSAFENPYSTISETCMKRIQQTQFSSKLQYLRQEDDEGEAEDLIWEVAAAKAA